MEEALQKGDVDAIVTGSLRQLKNEVIFEKMAEQPFYFIVKKGNQDLLDELDNALEHLFMDKPNTNPPLRLTVSTSAPLKMFLLV